MIIVSAVCLLIGGFFLGMVVAGMLVTKSYRDEVSLANASRDKAYRANGKLGNKIHKQRLNIRYLKQFAPKKERQIMKVQ